MSRMLRMSEEDYAARKVTRHLIEPAKSKYRNERFKDDEGSWDSKKEKKRWGELQLLAKAGQIQDLKRQVEFELIPPEMRDGKRLRPIVYLADFTYTEAGKPVVEDSKGFRNRLYKLKKRLMWWIHKIEILET